MITPVAGISIMGTNCAPVDMVSMCTMAVQLSPMLELDISNINVSLGKSYQALIGCNILGGLHAGRVAVLGPVVIHMVGPGTMGYFSWMQPKSGCMAYAKMLVPSAGGVSLVTTMAQVPPPPTKKSATFEFKGIRLSKEHQKQLRALETERDA